MAGSHEVRGSIPLCSTKIPLADMETCPRVFLLQYGLGGSNPERAQQPTGLLREEREARRSKTRSVLSIPLCSTTIQKAGFYAGLFLCRCELI